MRRARAGGAIKLMQLVGEEEVSKHRGRVLSQLYIVLLQYLREASDVWGYSTECGGINRGVSPRLILTHEEGITHALEHGRKYWHYFK